VFYARRRTDVRLLSDNLAAAAADYLPADNDYSVDDVFIYV